MRSFNIHDLQKIPSVDHTHAVVMAMVLVCFMDVAVDRIS